MNTLNDKLSIASSYAATSVTAKVPEKVIEGSVGKTGSAPPLGKFEAELKQRDKADAPTGKEMDALVKQMNAQLEKTNNYMMFKKDSVSGRDVFSLIDANSKEVIKQFPSEEFLHMSRDRKSVV